MSPIYINTTTFTQANDSCTGIAMTKDLERSEELLVGNRTQLHWTLKGEQTRRVDGGVEQYLGLKVQGFAVMQCLRCLSPVDIAVGIDRQFRLAKDEAQAAKLDQDDELVDAIVGSQRFDIMELVEDELIMSLPYSPKHEDCKAPGFSETTGNKLAEGDLTDGEGQFERPNPFSALAQLKKPIP